MRKFIYISLTALLTVSFFSGCKKGENDPFISFRSRDARLEAKWKLTKIEATDNMTSAGVTTTRTSTFDGTTFTIVDPTTGKNSGAYALTLNIHGNGTIEYNENISSPSYTQNTGGTGNWTWINSNKNKTELNLYNVNSTFFQSKIYTIDRLSTNELVIKLTGGNTLGADVNTSDYTWTFSRQK